MSTNKPMQIEINTGQQSKQEEIDKLTRELEIMKGWAKLAKANGEDVVYEINGNDTTKYSCDDSICTVLSVSKR